MARRRGSICPTCGANKPLWMDLLDGAQLKDQVLTIVTTYPGLTTGEIAAKLKARSSHVYSCLAWLTSQGKVEEELMPRERPKDGEGVFRRQWQPVR